MPLAVCQQEEKPMKSEIPEKPLLLVLDPSPRFRKFSRLPFVVQDVGRRDCLVPKDRNGNSLAQWKDGQEKGSEASTWRLHGTSILHYGLQQLQLSASVCLLMSVRWSWTDSIYCPETTKS